MKRKITVVLNGTDENPFHRMGLSQNPFPQIAEAEYTDGCLQIQKLGGDPIPNTLYIRKALKGFSAEFVNLCCRRFKKGKLVRFVVTFEDGRKAVKK